MYKRIMVGDDHLHFDKNDQIANWLIKALRTVTGGRIVLDAEGRESLKIEISDDNIIIDLLQPTLFKAPEDETGLFDKLKTAKEFSQKLTDNGVTVSFLRKGKKAITLGKEANHSFSKLLTGSGDMKIDSFKETINLKRDLKAN
jgi:hypothetical protein